MTFNNETFPKDLLSTPPVPDGILPEIHRRIRRRAVATGICMALVACLALSAGAFLFLPALEKNKPSPHAYETGQSHAVEELETAYYFINGLDIEYESEFDVFAFANNSSF